MIKKSVNEFREGDLGISDIKITFFGIPIFRQRSTTTNRQVVSMLTVKESSTKIKGFSNETED